METSTREQFRARCTQVAAIAEQAGATIVKAPTGFAIVVSRGDHSVSFPLVSDPRDWRETSPEAALYAALTDLFAWASASGMSEATYATLDVVEKTGVPFIHRDLDAEKARLRDLTDIVGGIDVVRRMWQAAGIDENAAAGVS